MNANETSCADRHSQANSARQISSSIMPRQNVRVAQAVAFVEDVKRREMHWPDQLPEVAAGQRDGGENHSAVAEVGARNRWREAAKAEDAKGEINRGRGEKRQVAAQFDAQGSGIAVGAIEMFVDGGDQRQHQRLLLREQRQNVRRDQRKYEVHGADFSDPERSSRR